MMACNCPPPPFPPCPECSKKNAEQAQRKQHVMEILNPVYALQDGSISLEKYISDFILTLKEFSDEIGHVVVVFDNITVGNTLGIGSIAGVKDMNRCVEMLENYTETLKSGITTLN